MEAAFDVYFRGVDLDCGDQISGEEVVAFFKGSGLPQPVLTQNAFSRHSTDGVVRLFLGNEMMTPFYAGGEQDLVTDGLVCSAKPKLSNAGGCLIISRDGVWDALTAGMAFRCARGIPPEAAADQIVKEAVEAKGLRDDTTCIVIDIVPPEKPKCTIESLDGHCFA